MKAALFVLMLFLSARVVTAQPPALPEQLEFRFESAFGEGTRIWLKRTPDGKIECSVDSIPAPTEPRGVKQNKPPKKVEVSAADFRMLAVEIEGTTLREECEKSDPVGIDGTRWIFRRLVGGRTLELRLNSPETVGQMPRAYALGAEFVTVARIDGVLPKQDRSAPSIPEIVPDLPFDRKSNPR